jgi:hypothetical protein
MIASNCGARRTDAHGAAAAIYLLAILMLAALFPLLDTKISPAVYALPEQNGIAPSKNWGVFFGTSGDVQINIDRKGIAVRVEIPREFRVPGENVTNFVQSDIRNDYYYYNVVDEAAHWSYDWNKTASNAPCFKPGFSMGYTIGPVQSSYDQNAPWCVEIWNYLNGTGGGDNCVPDTLLCPWRSFVAPRFIRFHGLNSPNVAGQYNFTIFVADHPNNLGFPDFVNAWTKTLVVPVSMIDNPASISGVVVDADAGNVPVRSKGVVYAQNINTGQISRAYLNQTLGNEGFFNLTGLAPGDYKIQASAGVFNGIAYSLGPTPPITFLNVQRGHNSGLLSAIGLKHAPQVCGFIKYIPSLAQNPSQTPFAHSATDNPYLRDAGIKILNITVEATVTQASDSSLLGHIFRFMNVSANSTVDSFRIITGNGTKYVGTDPYGTEFAGLPSTAAGSYQLSVSIWVTGYLRDTVNEPIPVTITSMPGPTNPIPCNFIQPSGLHDSANTAAVVSGGIISGIIRLSGDTLLETPHEAEDRLPFVETHPPTDALFGGNIVIQAYDHTGTLRGVVVKNGTLPDGKTSYANCNSPSDVEPGCTAADAAILRFFIVGVSEFYNRTWSGTWGLKDYGLPDDTQNGGYQLKVSIRGYEMSQTDSTCSSVNPCTLTKGAIRNATIVMIRGGAVRVGIFSFDNRFGSRALQAEFPWRFLNLSIPVRARVYFYDSAGRIVGYVERLMVIRKGVPNGVNATSFTVIFAGQNWSLRDIWFFGQTPSHLGDDTYSLNGYTLGYVQQRPISTFVGLKNAIISSVPLLIANGIDLTVPIFADPFLFSRIPEHDHVIGETFSGTGLAGATIGNLSAGIPTLLLPIFGFGGMVLNTTFVGQGHFFYISPAGTQYFDYGLDVGTYTTQVPEFGFNRHFIPILTSVTSTFTDLFLISGIFLNVYIMASICVGVCPGGSSFVGGWVAFPVTTEIIPLSWVTVTASSANFTASVPTLDGDYDGPGKLFLPQGVYDITFSDAFYLTATPFDTTLNFHVQWNNNYSLIPPQNNHLLCPIADTSVCPLPLPVLSIHDYSSTNPTTASIQLIVLDLHKLKMYDNALP